MRRPELGRLGLPVLPNIYVASPCPADWSKMTPAGDAERVRMCKQCNKHVFNLSQMSRSDAEELIIEKNGNLCVRYYQRKDGTILLKDCTVAASAARKRQMIAAGAAALLATGGGFAMLTAHRSASAPAEATRIVAPTPSAEIEFRFRAQEKSKDDPPPVVIAPLPPPPPEELILEKEDWHVTGGAVAIPDDEMFK